MNLAGYFNNHAAQALLWTLVHSLWQGAAAALLAAICLAALRRRGAALRYQVLVGITCLFVLAAVCTFITEVGANSGASGAGPQTVLITDMQHLPAAGAAVSGWSRVAHQIEAQAPLLLSAWLLFLLFRATMLAFGFRYTYRLRRQGLEEVPTEWSALFEALLADMKIGRRVGFFQSALVQVPLVVGHLKPVVLVPLGMCAQLRPEEVEAILVHELAHIRRNDYLVNLFQHGLELLFFFNPLLMWLSARIRREREYCCDDIAVDFSGSPRAYAEALLSYQEVATGYQLAAALHTGRRMPLLDRIHRLLSPKHQNLNTMEKITVFTGLLATVALSLTITVQAQQTPPPPPKAKASAATTEVVDLIDPSPAKKKAKARKGTARPSANRTFINVSTDEPQKDTVPTGSWQATMQDKDKTYKMKLEGTKLVALSIDGEAIPESRFGEYDGMVKELIERHKEAQQHRREAEVHRREAELHRKEAEARRVEVSELRERQVVRTRDHEQAMEEHNRSMKIHREALERHKATLVDQERRSAEHEVRMKEHRQRMTEHAERMKEHAVRMEEHKKRMEVHEIVYSNLVSDGLISKDSKSLNYDIRDGALYINDVRQDDKVSQKYLRLIREENEKRGLK